MDIEEWAYTNGYTRVNCVVHGHSWSNKRYCEACNDAAKEKAIEEIANQYYLPGPTNLREALGKAWEAGNTEATRQATFSS